MCKEHIYSAKVQSVMCYFSVIEKLNISNNSCSVTYSGTSEGGGPLQLTLGVLNKKTEGKSADQVFALRDSPSNIPLTAKHRRDVSFRLSFTRLCLLCDRGLGLRFVASASCDVGS